MIFNIKYGLSENLSSAEKIKGCWYVTHDTFELWYCPDGNELICMNKMEPFDPSPIISRVEDVEREVAVLTSRKLFETRIELPAAGSENIVYYIESENASYMWSNEQNRYYRVGTDYNTIEAIAGGTATAIEKNGKTI